MWSHEFKLFLLLMITRESLGRPRSNSQGYINDLITSFNSLASVPQQVLTTEVKTINAVLNRMPHTVNEDVYLNISQLVNKYGYRFEAHNVITQDGYILGLHRIPGHGQPVLLHHGIMLSSDDFVTAGPQSALSYYLASLGYDVWIANARGNKYSRRHQWLRPEQFEFWNFSWHEIGIYDLPAQIDYILRVTGRQKLNYVGYSQGTTSLFVLGSERPEYNNKINVAVAMSPVAWFNHIFSPVLRLFFAADIFRTLIKIRHPEFDIKVLFDLLCHDDSITTFLCVNAFYIAFGFNRAQTNITNLPVILSHTPAPVSCKQFVHYQQLFESGYFRKYDYGRKGNMKRYGSRSPPNYNLRNVVMPISLLYSDSDYFASTFDVEILASHLPNLVERSLIRNFNHIDFLFGVDIIPQVYTRIARLFNDYPKY